MSDPAALPLLGEPDPQPPRSLRCLYVFILLIVCTVGVGTIVLGTAYLNNCPAQKVLPIYIIVFGALLMVPRLLNCVYDYRWIRQKGLTKWLNAPVWIMCLSYCINLAAWIIFIAVCYFTYSITPSTKPEEQNYCNSVLYNVSYDGCIVVLILICLTVGSSIYAVRTRFMDS